VSHYAKHIFFCQNRREDGRPCCADNRSEDLAAHAKNRVKALGLNGP
jgi:hypothetical protein